MQNQLYSDQKSLNAMVNSVIQKGNFPSIDAMEEMILAISDYSNSIPKWILGGSSSNEIHAAGNK